MKSLSWLSFVFLLLLADCHQMQIVPLSAPRNGQTRLDVAGRSTSFLLGYFGGAAFKADCRDGVESVRISRGALDSVIQVLIGGIFSTRSVEVKCVRPHLNAAGIESGQKVRLQGVYFDSNSSSLQGDSYLVLDELVDYLRDHPDTEISLIGHTDLHGSDAANDSLSRGRADAGKQYLVSKGIAERRIGTEGRGSRQPVVRSLDDDSSALNRRLEVVLRRADTEPSAATANAPTSRAGTDTTIELTDGTILRGTITNQSREQIQVNVNGQLLFIGKLRIRRIVYARGSGR